MYKTLSKIHLLLSTLLILCMLPGLAFAQGPEESLSFLTENPVIHGNVLAAFAEQDTVPVLITLDLPEVENSRYADHPAAGTDVHPLIFELVLMSEEGTVNLEEVGANFAFQGRLSAEALRKLADNPDILAIEFDTNPVIPDLSTALGEPLGVSPKLHCPCSPAIGSTVGCVQSNRWRISFNHNGTNSRVAAYSSRSAAFYTFSSSNWEFVGKVLNGCSINNRWWVYGAGATNLPFTMRVEDANFCPNYKTYSGANPVLDTSAFTCP